VFDFFFFFSVKRLKLLSSRSVRKKGQPSLL
jgi:hypothetical protein